uniref:Uncharacterized protein n=1 Tax=Pseudomonas aeruginosa TaxID=287 RepID=A0A7S5YCL9_PSEAI|nr:hypothetical protein [Pseudomonas aeruginosa]
MNFSKLHPCGNSRKVSNWKLRKGVFSVERMTNLKKNLKS